MQIGLNTSTIPKCCHLFPPHPPPVTGGATTFSSTPYRFRPPTQSTKPTRKRRKNHLRPKILKTLTKPFPTAPLPEIVTTSPTTPIPIETPKPDSVSKNKVVLELELKRSQELVRVGDGTVITGSGSAGKLFTTRWVLKFCGYFVLVFVFQTICAVMILGNAGFDDDDDEKKKKQMEVYGRGLENGVGVLDEVEVGMRVNEIRAMARAVRERERKERGNVGGGEGSGREIEKEIGERLVRLGRKLNSEREKFPNSVVDYLGYGSDEEDDVDGSDDDDDDDDLELKKSVVPLMFKNKFWFKGPGVNTATTTSPKGFRAVNVNGGTKVSNFDAVPTQNDNNELHPKGLKKETRFGAVKESSEGRSFSEVSKSQNAKDSFSSKKEQHERSLMFTAPASSPDQRKGPTVMREVKNKQPDEIRDIWWLKLPYVLAILMRRGSEGEGPSGFYGVKETSETDGTVSSSYTLAFEDRGDANNFCYLLESFFEDLGDFKADIIPLPVKELGEEVVSKLRKVLVVKKGQLKLYVGQPFAEVEMALHSLLPKR